MQTITTADTNCIKVNDWRKDPLFRVPGSFKHNNNNQFQMEEIICVQCSKRVSKKESCLSIFYNQCSGSPIKRCFCCYECMLDYAKKHWESPINTQHYKEMKMKIGRANEENFSLSKTGFNNTS
jgi:hypothetical protein